MALLDTEIVNNLREKDLESFVDELSGFMASGATLRDLRGLTDANMEALYALAYSEYNQANYDKALDLFRMLCNLDHLEHRFWLGLGATRQMQRDYQHAIEAYVMAMMLDIDQPIPPLHMAECQLAIGDRESAETSFEYAVHAAGDKPQFQTIKHQAEAKLEILRSA